MRLSNAVAELEAREGQLFRLTFRDVQAVTVEHRIPRNEVAAQPASLRGTCGAWSLAI